VGETLGLLSALQWVHELSLGPIDFVVDSNKVVDSVASNKHEYATKFGSIIYECKTLLSHFYENSSVEFVW
jgi:ribonuclease HI